MKTNLGKKVSYFKVSCNMSVVLVFVTDSEQFHEWMAHEAYAETRRRVFVQTPHVSELFEQLDAHGILALQEDIEETKVQGEQRGTTNGAVKGRKTM